MSRLSVWIVGVVTVLALPAGCAQDLSDFAQELARGAVAAWLL